MRAAYAVVDGVFETTTAAAFEFGCQRQHVNYYVRKLAGQGLVRSESTQSSRSRRSESSGWSRRLSSSSAMSSSSHDDIENEPARNAVVPDPADDPWARFCMAYMYAGLLAAAMPRGVGVDWVSPFNEKVYWELRAAEEKAKKVATVNEVNPELLTLKGVVGIMYGVDAGPQQPQQSGRRRSREACLHSSDLWDLPGGATGDECFSIVQAKSEAKKAKIDACNAAKARRVEGREGKRAASLALGSQVIASLQHDAQVSALKLPAL